jgi:hypothetical protein
MNEQERNEHNALAWLALSDWELVERSASLDHQPQLHPNLYEESGILPTRSELASLREAADAVAREHAGDEFVGKWINENRPEDNTIIYNPQQGLQFPPVSMFRPEED